MTPEREAEIKQCLSEGWSPHDSWRQVVTELWNERGEILAALEAQRPSPEHIFDLQDALMKDAKVRAIYERGKQDANDRAIDREAERIERAIRETGERMALTIAAAIVAQSESGEARTANRGLFGTSWANDAWNATAQKENGDAE